MISYHDEGLDELLAAIQEVPKEDDGDYRISVGKKYIFITCRSSEPGSLWIIRAYEKRENGHYEHARDEITRVFRSSNYKPEKMYHTNTWWIISGFHATQRSWLLKRLDIGDKAYGNRLWTRALALDYVKWRCFE